MGEEGGAAEGQFVGVDGVCEVGKTRWRPQRCGVEAL